MKRLEKFGTRTSRPGRAGTARYRVNGKGGIRFFHKFSAAARFAGQTGRASVEVRTETEWVAVPL